MEQFVEHDCIPAERLFEAQIGNLEKRWKIKPEIMDQLKAKAQKLGLWNLFLVDSSRGPGYSTLEYGLMAEYLGKSHLAPEVR